MVLNKSSILPLAKDIGLRGALTSIRYSLRTSPGINLVFGRKVSVSIKPEASIECSGRFDFGLNSSAVHDSTGGSRLRIDDTAVVRIAMGGGVARIGPGSHLRIEGNFTMGGSSYISGKSNITCREELKIGRDSAIAWGVDIMDTNMHHHVIEGELQNYEAPVVIGDDVWIGANATILPGVTIENNAIVAANSVVTGTVESGTMVAGNPASVVATDVCWY